MTGSITRVAMCFVAASVLMACGGDGVNAPESEAPPDCRRVDDYLGGVYQLLDEGKLANFQAFIEDDLPEDARRDLVDSLIRLLGAFEPGTFSNLAPWIESLSDSTLGGEGGLQVALADIIRWIVADGPGAPYPDVLASLRATVNTCRGPPVLASLRVAVTDDPLVTALITALTDGGLGEALDGLTFRGDRGREAFTLLIRNLLIAASGPDFDVRSLTDLLGFIVDTETGPWGALIDGLERWLGPGPSLDGLQGFLACLVDVDPDVALGGLIYDLLASSGLDLTSLLGDPPASGTSALDPALQSLLVQTLDFFIADAAARRSLVVILTEILRADIAPAVLTDVGDLLEADALTDIVELLVVVATKACQS